MTGFLILAVLFAVAVAVFAVANTEPVTINLIFNQLQMSLALVIIGSAALGALTVGIVSVVRQVGLRFRLWDRENRSRRFEKESVELKTSKTELESEVERLSEELSEAEAYTAHLEELLRQRGHEGIKDTETEDDQPTSGEETPHE